MIEKVKLLKRLENAKELEDRGIIIITSGLKKKLEDTEISVEERSRLIEILDIIKRDSEGHMKAFEAMADQVREDSRYVF